MNRNGKGSNGIWEDWVVVSPPKVDFGEISSDKNEERVFECSVKIQNIRSHGIKLNFQVRIFDDHLELYDLNTRYGIILTSLAPLYLLGASYNIRINKSK